jgi:hypothetical protein
VFVTPSVEILSEDKKIILGSLKINCVFKFLELAEYCDSKTKKVKLPESIITTLNSIALSSCRGVMVSHFKGTILHSAILPLLDPSSFSMENANKK